MTRGRLLFWLMVALQALGLLGFVASREVLLGTGKEVVLQTVPVDPRDLFRGDYVRLRYDISRLNRSKVDHIGFIFTNRTVYVTLAPEGEVWKAVSANDDLPSGDAPRIRGRVTDYRSGAGGLTDVEYGIEEYFVPEGTGREIERAQGKVRVKVVVDGWGNAAIKELILP